MNLQSNRTSESRKSKIKKRAKKFEINFFNSKKLTMDSSEEYILNFNFFNFNGDEDNEFSFCEINIDTCVVRTNRNEYFMRMVPNRNFLEVMKMYIVDENWKKLDRDCFIGAQLLNASDNLEKMIRENANFRKNYEHNMSLRDALMFINPYQAGLMNFSSHISIIDVSLN